MSFSTAETSFENSYSCRSLWEDTHIASLTTQALLRSLRESTLLSIDLVSSPKNACKILSKSCETKKERENNSKILDILIF